MYKVQIATVNVQINKINIEQDKISITLLLNHILKSRKRRTMFDDEVIGDNYQNKTKRKALETKKHSRRRM